MIDRILDLAFGDVEQVLIDRARVGSGGSDGLEASFEPA
jgi:hypothetical protein